MHSIDDTIAAIATATGGAARAIVRVSGPNILAIVRAIFEPAEPTDWSSLLVATRIPGNVQITLDGRRELQSLPCDLFLWPTKLSYTRQPVAEFHTLGSPPLVEAVLRTVCSAGARLAEPGEFTLRAFLAGRIDLVQAEAVLGVIDAADRRQLDAALAQMAGGLTRPLQAVRDELLDLLADLEAGLDFVEEDIRFLSAADLERRLETAAQTIGRLAAQMQSRARTDVEPRVALVGSPNVGKSSLFNALAAGATALVSDAPGTTRDYLAARLDLDGLACMLIDTAGFDNSAGDQILSVAAQLMKAQRETADLELLCLDSSRPVNAWESAQLLRTQQHMVVFTKSDLPGDCSRLNGAIATSVVTGFGLNELRATIRSRLGAAAGETSPAGVVAATAVRCRESLRLAGESLERAHEIARRQAGDELIAGEIRAALSELGKVVGAIYTDDLLDRIFSRFCIGK